MHLNGLTNESTTKVEAAEYAEYWPRYSLCRICQRNMSDGLWWSESSWWKGCAAKAGLPEDP